MDGAGGDGDGVEDGDQVGQAGDGPRADGGDSPVSDGDPVALAETYYRAIDEDDFDLLASVLAPDFVHERPELTLDGRDRFVRFMREERPQSDTSHPIDGIYVPAESGRESENGRGTTGDAATEVLARGRLLASDGSEIVAFVDVFDVGEGALQHLRTFTR